MHSLTEIRNLLLDNVKEKQKMTVSIFAIVIFYSNEVNACTMSLILVRVCVNLNNIKFSREKLRMIFFFGEPE